MIGTSLVKHNTKYPLFILTLVVSTRPQMANMSLSSFVFFYVEQFSKYSRQQDVSFKEMGWAIDILPEKKETSDEVPISNIAWEIFL